MPHRNLPDTAFDVQEAGLRYGAVRALADLRVTVRHGERVAVIGPSGAGKSTLIGLLGGALVPSEGRVHVLGHDLAAASPREARRVQRSVGTIHQQFHLVDQLRVVHNVNAGRLGSWPVWKAALSLALPLALPSDTDGVRQVLDRVGIGDKLYERTENLSGGEQQRVAIARVLVQQPVAILADEPLASLDPSRGSEVMNLLQETSAERGAALLASLHDVDVALDRFERVLGLREGRLVFDAAPRELSRETVRDLYAVAPSPEPT